MAKMAKRIGPIICLFLMLTDIVAGILGIEAEIAQDKEKHMKVWVFECRQPSYEAYKLGLAAAVLLALAHSIASVLGGCICIRSKDEFDRSSANKQLAAGSLVLSWIILVIAFSLLVIGTVSNARSSDTCGFPHRHLLSVGGVLCFIHGLFLVAYYISATATAAEDEMLATHRPTAI